MKSRISIIVALAVSANTIAYTQEQQKERSIKLNSITYSKGLFNFYPQLNFDTHGDFLNITTSPSYYASKDSEFFWDSYGFGVGNGLYGSGTRIQLGIGTKNFKSGTIKPNRQFNIGIFTNGIYFYELGKKTEIIGDTTITTTAQYSIENTNIGFDINHTFSTDANKLVKLYTGYGIEAGISFYRRGRRTERERKTLDIVQGSQTYQIDITPTNKPYSNEGTRVDVRPGFSYVGLYIPLGIEVSLSKEKPVLKDLSIGLDTRLGLNVYSFGNRGLVTTQNLSMNTAIRYRLNN